MFTNPTAEASRSLLIDLPHWFAAHQRNLPMRAQGVSDWGTLVFEIMSQQTPISRVQPIWLEWMERWPTPADLATASSADIIVAWANLGYPSRALRLKACAAAIVEKHDGEVPLTMKELTLLPGVGTYTASALLAFRHGIRVPVLDTNVRRVLVRFLDGREFPPHTTPSKAETMRADALLPEDGHRAAEVSLSLMEFGALVCTQLSPSCDECTISNNCAWALAGFPKNEKRPTPQPYVGTDRQARGRIMKALRTAHFEGTDGLTKRRVLDVARIDGGDRYQPTRVYRALLKDGMIVYNEDTKRVTLPR
ncbi:A/G-specific adenine glycosylase [Sanguibacter keddieii]|uniref:A/G-specific adenine glycosylase n=1 Tax=Sanguibacter keddieii TaxID=60920 RepID=UPI000A4C3774|nr:A/G-specific adenine glycosylase [Sanguibacter keddieii]